MGLDRVNRNNSILFDIQLAVAMGEWERLNSIVEREWPNRNQLNSDVLMALARCAYHQGDTRNRALPLAKLASANAPSNPVIQLAAYWLYFELGKDDEADSNLFTRALENSTPKDGPLWKKDADELVHEWVPNQRRKLRELDSMVTTGKLPLGVATSLMNQPLVAILLDLPSAHDADEMARFQTLVPIISGVRDRVELECGCTIGFDISTIMVVWHLGLLETIVNSIGHTKLSHELMTHLFAERNAAKFHQPSRVQTAHRIKELVDDGLLDVVGDAPSRSSSLESEVGTALAGLLTRADEHEGLLICNLPITRIGSLRREPANVDEYRERLFSPADLCDFLFKEGLIDKQLHLKASALLAQRGQFSSGCAFPQTSAKTDLYLDEISASNLENAEVLTAIARGDRFQLHIHRSTFFEANSLINVGRKGTQLAKQVEDIRTVLLQGIEQGKVSFLEATQQTIESEETATHYLNSTESLIASSHLCDVICIDDRYINSYSNVDNGTGSLTPTICSVDLLNHLKVSGTISQDEYFLAKHRLRSARYAYVHLETEELLFWLKSTNFDAEGVLESAELRTLRRSFNAFSTQRFVNDQEAPQIVGNITETAINSIRELWQDSSVAIAQVKHLASWTWKNLVLSTFGLKYFERGQSVDVLKSHISLGISLLLEPPRVESADRLDDYTNWVNQFIIAPLRVSNSEVIKQSVLLTIDHIAAYEKHSKEWGNLFLLGLPELEREYAIAENPTFANRCGFLHGPVITLGGRFEIRESDLYNGVRAVLKSNQPAEITTLSGRSAVLNLVEQGGFSIGWSDQDGPEIRIQMPELLVLSPNGADRVKSLQKSIEALGPTSPDFRDYVDEIRRRELKNNEVSQILGEHLNGVATAQQKLTSKLQTGLFLDAGDFSPKSIGYLERYCGPLPGNVDIETYLEHILIPYRKELIARDFTQGFDICCLGGLRHVLYPGNWIGNYSDDVVWCTLEKLNFKNNPMAALAALDVALHRVHDDRFAHFASLFIERLLDENLGHPSAISVYRLLGMLFAFQLNLIGRLPQASTQPNYWRRMCAWMQTGLIMRSVTSRLEDARTINLDELEKWFAQRETVAGNLPTLVGLRTEPLLLTDLSGGQSIRMEVIKRLFKIKELHEGEERRVPHSSQIESAWNQLVSDGLKVFLPPLGPLDTHIPPTATLRADFMGLVKSVRPESTLNLLAVQSQHFILGEPAREFVCLRMRSIEPTRIEDPEGFLSIFFELNQASVIASANRDAQIADSIGTVIKRIASVIEKPEHLDASITVLLQTAAAFSDIKEWFGWMKSILVHVAEAIPETSETCIRRLMGYFHAFETALPVEMWFHLEAVRVMSARAFRI